MNSFQEWMSLREANAQLAKASGHSATFHVPGQARSRGGDVPGKKLPIDNQVRLSNFEKMAQKLGVHHPAVVEFQKKHEVDPEMRQGMHNIQQKYSQATTKMGHDTHMG